MGLQKKVAFPFDRRKPTCVFSDKLTSQIWDMHDPRLLSYKDDWDPESLSLLSQSTDLVTDAWYCRAFLDLTVSRRPNFIDSNIMVVISLVGTMSFATYALDPSELGDRQSCVLTLVLTTVAYKYVTTSMIPEISLRDNDRHYHLCMHVSSGIYDVEYMLTSLIVSLTSERQALGIAWFGILVSFLIKSIILGRKRNQYTSDCEEKVEGFFESE